jgi:hypothetical protein
MNVFALDSRSTLALYEHLFMSLSSKKIPVVYVEDKKYKEIFIRSEKMKLARNIAVADIVLITNEKTLEHCDRQKKLKNKKICFSTEYRFLKQSNAVVGASYWKKGRAQLLFVANRLKAFKIALSPEYRKFMIETL